MRKILVKVHPSSSRQQVAKQTEEKYEVWVRARAEKGAANQEMRALLAAHFGIAPSAVVILRGMKTTSKLCLLYDGKTKESEKKRAGGQKN
ncbi:DUF167 domain-containing protein [Candidatus Parcubacteria bacterium]|nr:MAG: DUF167 domain-containing protein [Candidatus Parcubacteria bacterium]